MGTSISLRRFCLTVAVGFVICNSTLAQEEEGQNFSYDDEIAVGDLSYEEEGAESGEVTVEAEATAELSAEAALDSGEESQDEQAEVPEEDLEDETESGEKLKPWDWGGPRHHSNLKGATGLFHIVEGGSDESGTFGVGMHGWFFKYSDFLFYGDEHVGMWGGTKLRVSFLKFLEVYALLESSSNHNTYVSPSLYQTLGDVLIGVKSFHSPYKWLSVGGLFALDFMNPIGKIAVSFEGLSFDLGLQATVDFFQINPKVPLRAHLNIGYFFDRSANIVDDIEKARGGCGADSDGDGTVDFEGCLNPVERYGLGINRNDQFRVGIGFDALLPYVSPLAEYFIEIPVNRQDFVCPVNIPGSPDSCMANEGVSGMHQWVTLGVRVLPPVDSLAIDLGVDIALTGYAPSVHEMAAIAPYRVIFGLTYNFNPFAEEPPAKVQAAVQEPSPQQEPIITQTVIAGYVHEDGQPDKGISGAIVTYVGQYINPQVTRADGRFVSYPLPSGPISIEVSAEGYETRTCETTIPESSVLLDNPYPPEGDEGKTRVATVNLDCPLVPLATKAVLSVKVTDPESKPLSEVTVTLDGPSKQELKTGPEGVVNTELDPGSYKLLIDKEGYFKKSKTFETTIGTRTALELQVSPKPEKASVIVKKKKIKITKKIHFEYDSAEIKADSFALMDEIADVLISHPELTLVEIQGHTDNKGQLAYNLDLSERRADSVRRYLVESGVNSDRLEARGMGPRKPIAPNITTEGRARNRRVEFIIKARASE